jgi:hypothetical protein
MSINCIPLLVYLFSCRFQKFDDDFVFRNLGIIFDNLMTLIYKLYIFVFEPRGVLETTVCDKVCQWLATGRWFSLGPPISSTNKTDHHDIAQIPMKVALDTNKKQNQTCAGFFFFFALEYQHFTFSYCRGCTRVFSQLIRYSTVWPGWSNDHLGVDNDLHIFWTPSWMWSLMRNFSSHRLLLSYAYKITLYVLSSGSEWMIVDYRQFSNFSAISWREEVNFQWDDDEIHFVLEHQA